ncbi:MAG: VWA domain-containing protein [Candidatus Babeliales bacterium]
MESFLFGNLNAFYIGIPVLILAIMYRKLWYKPSTYQFPLAGFLKECGVSQSYARPVLFFLRSAVLAGCLFLIARPQLVDTNSQVTVEGIDIMIVLDVSGSMRLFDDLQDQRSRIEVAKEEAIKFVDKRQHDPMGLVIFGAYAVSRCPLTLDKKMLKNIINDLKIDTIDASGTALSVALITAANRLRSSKAKSKIIILLTDGEPTPGYDTDPEEAVAIANKLGIKVYTVGIGSEDGGFVQDPRFGIGKFGSAINKRLLTMIAQKTGGAFFQAQKPEDMARVYETIDQLEKTDVEATIFTKYHDLLFPFIWLLLALCFIELFVRTFVWSGVSA